MNPRELAENANTYSTLGPDDERIENDRFVLWMGRGKSAHWNVAQRLRLQPDAIEATVEEVHALLSERGRDTCTWEVTTSATPADLRERLLTLGMVPDREPYAVAMVLDTEPPRGPAGVEARPVHTFDEYCAADDVQIRAFEDSPQQESEYRALREQGWARRDDERSQLFAAWLDGKVVAAGTASYTPWGVSLFGGATDEWARGRGAYRALVRARWDEAVRRGVPALVTQAGKMSRPILQRVGFREVAEIWILLDEFGARES